MNTKYSLSTRNALLYDAYTRPKGQSLTASQVYALQDAFRIASTKAKKEMTPQCTRVDEAKHYEQLLLKHLPDSEALKPLTLGSPTPPTERASRKSERLAEAEHKLAKAKASIPVLERLIERLRGEEVTIRPVKAFRIRLDPCSGPFPDEPNPLEYSTTVTDSQLRS